MPIRKSDIPEMVELYVAGATKDALAKRYHCDHRTLTRILTRKGVPIRSQGESRRLVEAVRGPRHGYDEREMIACYKAGASQPEMRAFFGVSHPTIRKILKRWGVPLRTRSEAALLRDRKFTDTAMLQRLAKAHAGYQKWLAAGNRPGRAPGKGKRAQRRHQVDET